MAAPAPLKPDPLLTASDPFIVPLVVAVPAGLLWLLCAGVLLTVPNGRLAAVALSLIVGVVLTTEDLPLEMPFVSVPLTAVTRLGAVLPVVD